MLELLVSFCIFMYLIIGFIILVIAMTTNHEGMVKNKERCRKNGVLIFLMMAIWILWPQVIYYGFKK